MSYLNSHTIVLLFPFLRLFLSYGQNEPNSINKYFMDLLNSLVN